MRLDKEGRMMRRERQKTRKEHKSQLKRSKRLKVRTKAIHVLVRERKKQERLAHKRIATMTKMRALDGIHTDDKNAQLFVDDDNSIDIIHQIKNEALASTQNAEDNISEYSSDSIDVPSSDERASRF